MNPKAAWIAAAIGLAAFTSGCVQYPTEKQQVVDQRPQLSFVVDDANTAASSARVFVDGLEVGTVGNFVQGRAALRVLPGAHVVRVESANGVLLEQRIYLADGVSQALIVK
jgi:hypothetical protein